MKKNNMYYYENLYAHKGYKYIAGIDEVGRGSWAGPIVVACVVLPIGYKNNEINDSKKISINKRERMFNLIQEIACDISIIFIDSIDVDKLNPKQATIKAMERSVKELTKLTPDIVLIDAEKINTNVKINPIIKGDEKSISIAAASIVAKVTRDKYMDQMDVKYPQYGFKKHKGYGTLLHLKALKKYGPIKNFHRFSYTPVKKVLLDLKTK